MIQLSSNTKCDHTWAVALGMRVDLIAPNAVRPVPKTRRALGTNKADKLIDDPNVSQLEASLTERHRLECLEYGTLLMVLPHCWVEDGPTSARYAGDICLQIGNILLQLRCIFVRA